MMTAQAERQQNTTAHLAARLMRQYRPLPAGRCCRADGSTVEIVNRIAPAGEPHTVINFREAIFTGARPLKVKVDFDYVVQELKDSEHGTWMTNNACELVQMWRDFASRARGNVLVAGLGLGVVVDMLARKRAVTGITVVERDPCIIELAKDRQSIRVQIEQADIHEYARELSIPKLSTRRFDCALLDTWQGTGEWVWQTEVVPLRRMLYGKIPRVHAWQEATMLGQVREGLFQAADIPEEQIRSRSHCHWYAFRVACARLLKKEARIRTEVGIPQMLAFREENSQDAQLRALAHMFCAEVGSDAWEKAFGSAWDEAWEVWEER